MDDQGVSNIVKSAYNVFNLDILRGCVWEGQGKLGAMRCKEGFCGMFDEFNALVDQDTFEWQAKLGLNVIAKINNMLMNYR